MCAYVVFIDINQLFIKFTGFCYIISQRFKTLEYFIVFIALLFFISVSSDIFLIEWTKSAAAFILLFIEFQTRLWAIKLVYQKCTKIKNIFACEKKLSGLPECLHPSPGNSSSSDSKQLIRFPMQLKRVKQKNLLSLFLLLLIILLNVAWVNFTTGT